MAADRTTQEKLMRTVYIKQIRDQFNLRSILLQVFERNVGNYRQGSLISLPLHIGESGGYGWSSSGTLPPAGNQQIERHTYNYKRLYARGEVDAAYMEDTASPQAADARPLDLETSRLVKQIRSGCNFDLFGSGDGLLASPTTASGTVITVDDTRAFNRGQRIDILLTASGAVGSGGVSAARIDVDHNASTITLLSGEPTLVDGGTDLAANPTNYGVYRHGSYNDAIMGLQGIVSASNPSVGNLGGIDRTTNAWWQAKVFNSGGGTVEPNLVMLEEMRSHIEQKSDGAVNMFVCGYNVFAKLMADLVGHKRFSGTATKLNGWAKAIMFEDEIPLVRDRHCPPDKIFALDTSKFTIFQNSEGQWWEEKDGNILWRVPNKHAYEFAWFRHMELVCHEPNAQAMYDKIDATIPV